MKRKIIRWLINYLGKTKLTYTNIDRELSFNWTKNVPNNNEWQHVSLTFECWMKKKGDGEIESFDEVAVHIGGESDK